MLAFIQYFTIKPKMNAKKSSPRVECSDSPVTQARLFLTVARCGSGQDTFASFVSRHLGISHFSLSDVLREIALEKKVKASRENLHAIKQDLQKQRGEGPILAVLLTERLKKLALKRAIVTGLRLTSEYRYFRQYFDVTLIAVTAPYDVRYSRLSKRGTERDPLSFEDFVEQDRREASLCDYDYLLNAADYSVDCSQPLAEFKRIVPSLIAGIPELPQPQMTVATDHR